MYVLLQAYFRYHSTAVVPTLFACMLLRCPLLLLHVYVCNCPARLGMQEATTALERNMGTGSGQVCWSRMVSSGSHTGPSTLVRRMSTSMRKDRPLRSYKYVGGHMMRQLGCAMMDAGAAVPGIWLS